METQNKPLKISMKIAGGLKGIIPSGIVEQLTIEIIDGVASFHFTDCKITKEFARDQRQKGHKCVYNERLKKSLTEYPNMTKEQIAKDIEEALTALTAKRKINDA